VPRNPDIKKVLILGSGAIKIGEAGEFDYSGSQCLKAMREEGIETVLVNPNIATIQTDKRLAGKVYFLPVNPDFVTEVIEAERPDGIVLSFGGQTALNCGVMLAKRGVLDKYGVKVLGTPIWGIEVTEDRDLFRKTMLDAGIPVARSVAVYSLEEAKRVVKDFGYPVMVRVAYTLGGRGSGVAFNEFEFEEIVMRGLASSMTHQVLIEEYIGTWKQIEYEVMRDAYGNSLTVCNMENILAMRVHTGDNIVVAPSQTLNNREYHLLRTAAIKATQACGVIGECNIQFALEPNSERYVAIEINARLSRSSALASKATGYPIAYIAAKLILGYSLPELINKVTGITTAAFEPSLDYVVVKMPRWDLTKFDKVTRHIGTQMKSVGEVMAIGRCFEEALQKAIRMLDIGRIGLVADPRREPLTDPDEIESRLQRMTDEIIFDVADALKAGFTVERISKLTSIDPWFIRKMANIVEMERLLRENARKVANGGAPDLLRRAKQLGFSDAQIAECIGISAAEVRELRKKLSITPVVKQIDTLAAEWPAKTNYLYLTYNGAADDIEFKPVKKVIVLGAGTYRIGSSVEFDWSTMNMVWALKENGIEEVIVINCNPETVSTDYDMSDKLYFEELTLERVLDIYEKERPLGVVVSVGGQTPNNLAPHLTAYGVKILGTESVNIDRAEDRAKFSALLDELHIPQPEWSAFTSLEDAKEFARKVSYPVLVRPSYVLSGAAMRVVWTPKQLEQFLLRAAKVSPEHPVVISKFIKDAQEFEIDGVSDGENVYIGAVIEHLEQAGVHSGDAIMCIPPQRLPVHAQQKAIEYATRIARSLKIKGPFNIQFLYKDGVVYVIECNLRASRSMPFVSKATGVNLISLAAAAMLNGKIPSLPRGDHTMTQVCVKAPQFSFMQLEGADPQLGVEMRSTGEVACFGNTFHEALIKALIAVGFKIPKPNGNILITVGGVQLKDRILNLAKDLIDLGFTVYATEHTAEYLRKRGGLQVAILHKISEPERKPNILDYLVEGRLELIINIPSTLVLEKFATMLEDEYLIRRKAVELGVPVLTTYEAAEAFVQGLKMLRNRELKIPYTAV
jgi:carbamoyl-phosphate synthase large subunit